ncbi:MAG: hypothetical protein ABIJ91_04960 [Candidatus Kuenenbacteria bacterium]
MFKIDKPSARPWRLGKYKQIILMALVMVVVGGGFSIGEVKALTLRENIMGKLEDVQLQAKMPSPAGGVAGVVALVIQGILGVLVLIFFILILLGGFKWMTSGGNEETITKSKKMIGNALIGLLIVVMAYAITYFVFQVIMGPYTPSV